MASGQIFLRLHDFTGSCGHALQDFGESQFFASRHQQITHELHAFAIRKGQLFPEQERRAFENRAVAFLLHLCLHDVHELRRGLHALAAGRQNVIQQDDHRLPFHDGGAAGGLFIDLDQGIGIFRAALFDLFLFLHHLLQVEALVL